VLRDGGWNKITHMIKMLKTLRLGNRDVESHHLMIVYFEKRASPPAKDLFVAIHIWM
jgi:hypothetical protein